LIPLIVATILLSMIEGALGMYVSLPCFERTRADHYQSSLSSKPSTSSLWTARAMTHPFS
jgi:hypothetical protein